MGLSIVLLGACAFGACALLSAALVGVVWVMVNERRSRNG